MFKNENKVLIYIEFIDLKSIILYIFIYGS